MDEKSDAAPASLASLAPAAPDVPVKALDPTSTPAIASTVEGAPAPEYLPFLVNSDEVLFGEEVFALFSRKLRVKLDPSVDRELFRRQCKRLKAAGYEFDSKPQAWSVAQVSEAPEIAEAAAV